MSLSPKLPSLNTCTVAVIGLGYVGLPLAVELSITKLCLRTGANLNRRVIGFDINQQRLQELRNGIDRTNETCGDDLKAAQSLEFTSDPTLLNEADVFVVTVPTPIDIAKCPDLTPLKKASATVGKAIQLRGIKNCPLVIYESTVYPGATEEVCVPILEDESGLNFNKDFFCGYSPERINPGDNVHKLTTIIKVTSGSSPDAADWVDNFYGSIIKAGTHLAPNLKVAEAAKVIENTQRDLNIALVNELTLLFRELEIDTLDVLQAASTKWNFLNFKPGLVGGHCIGVDPYYLTYKAEQVGYHPQIILAGRRINDGMGRWIVERILLSLVRENKSVSGMHALVLGLSFKENCPDLRNTKVVNIISGLLNYEIQVDVADPWVDIEEARQLYGIDVTRTPAQEKKYDIVCLTVAHSCFTQMNHNEWDHLLVDDGIIFDLKGIVPRSISRVIRI